MSKLESYTPCHCGSECYAFREDSLEGDCWGEVEAILEVEEGDGEYLWIHACQGHIGVYDGHAYEESTRGEDK